MRESHLTLIFVNRFFHPDISATSQMLSDLAFFLAYRGHKVIVVTSGQLYQQPHAALPKNEIVNDVEIVRIPTTRFGRHHLLGRAVDYASFYVSAAAALWNLARRRRVVVAKTDPPMLSLVVGSICVLRGVPFINWLQDLFPEIAYPPGASAIKRWQRMGLAWLRDKSLALAKQNVVLGDRMASYLRTRLGNGEKVTVIPNWADGRVVTPVSPNRNPIREEWGLTGRFVVAYSGNMGRTHEFQTILDAAIQLKDHARVQFLFVGDGRWRDWLAREAEDRCLRNMMFKPYQPREQLGHSLGAGDVHLISLRPTMEGFVVPSKFYGIAAAGRPTVFIGDPEGEIARILSRHDIGTTVRPGDVNGLVAVLLDFEAKPKKCAVMGIRARAAFEAEYDMPVALSRWEALLLESTTTSLA